MNEEIMKKIIIGLLTLSSVTAFGSDIILKPGKSVILEANVPTKVTCEQDGNLAPYLCRLQFESNTDFGTGKPIVTALKISMKNKNNNDAEIVYKRTELYRIEDGRNEQERANYNLENDRILRQTNDKLNQLVTRGICQKH
jgi:hypothetical protein